MTKLKPRLSVWPGRFAISRLAASESIPDWAEGGRLLSITRTGDELSILCDETLVPSDVRCERGWKAIAVRGPLDFEQVGVLSGITAPLAEAGISILALATYDTDFVFVRHGQRVGAVEALRRAGFDVSDA